MLQHHPDGYELVVAIVHRYAKLGNERIKRNSAGARHRNSVEWEQVVECRTPLFERGEDNAIQDAIVSGTLPNTLANKLEQLPHCSLKKYVKPSLQAPT